MINKTRIKLGLFIFALAFTYSTWAALGPINVKSNLDKPFLAEIDLTDIPAAEVGDLKVGLANAETFSKLKINYASVLSNLTFTVIPPTAPNKNPLLRIRSIIPITDPYLKFVIEAKSPSTQAVRAYTVLLDPEAYKLPSSDSDNVKPVVASMRPSAEVPPVVKHAPVQNAIQSLLAQKPADKNASRKVESGQTLYWWARQVKPEQATLAQTLAALRQANPKAFIAGDIQRLRPGVTLVVPEAKKIAALTPRQIAQILHLTAEHKTTVAETPKTKVKTLADKGKRSISTTRPAPTNQAKAVQKQNSELTLAELEKQVKERETRLQAAQTRLDELEKKLKTLQQGVPSSAAGTKPSAAPALASHSQKSTELPAQTDKIPVAAVIASTAIVPKGSASDAAKGLPEVAVPAAKTETSAAQTQVPVATKSAPSVVAPTEIPAVKAVPPVLPAPTETTWVDDVFDNLFFIVGLFMVFVVLIILVVKRRKRQQEHQKSSSIFGAKRDADSEVSALDEPIVTDVLHKEDIEQVEEADPIAEADVYLAYGREHRAEDLLKEALEKNPEAHDVRLKLMELYAARSEKALFEAQARAMQHYVGANGSEWRKVTELGRILDPDSLLYQEATTTAIDMSTPEPDGAPSIKVAVEPSIDKLEEESLSRLVFPEQNDEREDALPKYDDQANDLKLTMEEDFPDLPLSQEAEPLPIAKAESAQNLGLEFNVGALNENQAQLSRSLDPMADLIFLEPISHEKNISSEEELTLSEHVESSDSSSGIMLSDDPLQNKLDLAKVYLEMGDQEAARQVLQELENQTQGALKAEVDMLLQSIR